MDDKELLELAAKAVGICPHLEVDIVDWEDGNDAGSDHYCKACGKDPYPKWNPLENDGDAFRLMVELGMAVEVSNRKLAWASSEDSQYVVEIKFNESTDPYAATRRAIVRAAAEIGNQS